MEDYKIDIVLDKGPSRTFDTDRTGSLYSDRRDDAQRPADLAARARFGIQCHWNTTILRFLKGIVNRSARIPDVSIDSDAALEIALRSRGTPRIANALLAPCA